MSSSAGMSEFRREALESHNDCRRLHSAPPLKPAVDLERSAQAWAESLLGMETLANSPAAKRGEYGENIRMRCGTAAEMDISGDEVSNDWYSDVEKYNFEEGAGKAGNFTQLVWIGSREVGFGKATARGKVVVVAHYRPPGNVRTRYVANVKPADPARQRPAQSSGELEGYRVIKHEVEEEEAEDNGKFYIIEREKVQYQDDKGNVKEKISERRREKPKESTSAAAAAGRRRKNSSTSSESDSDKDEKKRAVKRASQATNGVVLPVTEKEMHKYAKRVLAQHNKYRSRHGAKHLKLNKELTVLAQAFAEELSAKTKLHNSNAISHGNRLGENIASRWSNGVTDYAAEDVVDHWYKESENFRYNEELTDIKGVGNFTQIVWKASKELGVGKAVFRGNDGSHKVVVVCYYSPSGNVLDSFRENVQQPGK